jgi:hypothetical protein
MDVPFAEVVDFSWPVRVCEGRLHAADFWVVMQGEYFDVR